MAVDLTHDFALALVVAVHVLANQTAKVIANDDPDAADRISSLVTWGVEEDGLTLRQPGSRNAGFGGATNVNADTYQGADRLILDFPVTGEFLFTDAKGTYGEAGGNVYAELSKDMRLFLVKVDDPKSPWKIDDWRVTNKGGKILPDTQG